MFSWLLSKNLTLGQWGEAIAKREYKKQGYSILASNVFNHKGKRLGEIDFVAKNDAAIIFVEVKTRTYNSSSFGSGAEAVDVFKQRKLLKIVKLFLNKYRQYNYLRPQIDVCVITVNRLDSSTGPGVDRANYSVRILPNAVEDQ